MTLIELDTRLQLATQSLAAMNRRYADEEQSKLFAETLQPVPMRWNHFTEDDHLIKVQQGQREERQSP